MSKKSRMEILQELNEVGEKIDKLTSSYSKQRKNRQIDEIEKGMNSLKKEIRLNEDRETYNKLLDKLQGWYVNPEFSKVYTKRKPRVPNIEPLELLVDRRERLEELAELEKKPPFTAQEMLAKSGSGLIMMTDKAFERLEERIKKDQEGTEKLETSEMEEEEELERYEKAEREKVVEKFGKEDEEMAKVEEEPPSPPPLPTPRTIERLIQEQQELEKEEEEEAKVEEEEAKVEEEEAKAEEEEAKAEEEEVKKEEEKISPEMEEIHNNIRKEEREKVMKEFNLVDPTIGSIDIPKERLGVEGKTTKILNDDIKYFINRFPDMLKVEADVYKKTNKKNKKALQDIHRRIQAKLSPDPKKEEEGKKVGIILDADKFIDMKISELLATKTLEGLTPSNLVNITEVPKSEARDVGSYTITKRAGRDVINNAPVYRSIPTTQPQKPKRKGEINQNTIYKNTAMDKVDIARMEMRDNPFIRKQKTKPLNIIL